MTRIEANSYQRLSNLAQYAAGTGINHSESAGSAVKTGMSYAAFEGASWLVRNRKNIKGGWEALKATDRANRAIMNTATSSGKTVGNIWEGASEITAKAELEALANAKNASNIKNAAEAALQSGGNYAQSLEAINSTRSAWSKFNKGGAGTMAAFEFGIGCVTDVYPAFKNLGTGSGFKQLGKTAVKAAATGVGWWAGAAIGSKAGAAIGSAIGSAVCPGLGTAVGAAIGFIGGALGSWLCGKLASKIVGPSEMELAQQKEIDQMAKNAATGNGEVSSIDIQKAAYLKLGQSYIENNGELTEQDLQAKKDLEVLLGEKIDLERAALAYQQETSGAAGAETQLAQDQTQEVQNPSTQLAQTTQQTSDKEEVKQEKKRETLADVYRSMGVQMAMAPNYTFTGQMNTSLPLNMNINPMTGLQYPTMPTIGGFNTGNFAATA